MANFTINDEFVQNEELPAFSLTIEDTDTTVIYSDTDMQVNLVESLQNNGKMMVFDQQEGLYERLTVEENIKFFHKWFACATPLPEILVFFELQSCAKKAIYKCSDSEIRRIYFAKYYMSDFQQKIFQEPIQSVDITTMNTFIKMLQKFKDNNIPVLLFVSNMEHALLLGDVAYKLQEDGIHKIEIDDVGEQVHKEESSNKTFTLNLFKIPAKVDDKVILFDPPEIDYIESQNGKAMIVINDESYNLDSTLTEIEEKLEIYGFYRCHRSYIVNLQKVREIITWSKNTYSLRINNKTQSTIPLSRTKIQDIQEKFSLH